MDASHTRLDHESLSFHWVADHGASIADQASIGQSIQAAKKSANMRLRCAPDGTARHSCTLLRRAGPPRVGGGPSGPRRGQVQFSPSIHARMRCRVQASRLVRSIPPGSTPDNRPDAGGHVKAGAERSGAPPAGHWPYTLE